MRSKGGRKIILFLLTLFWTFTVSAQYYNQLPSYLNANSNWVFGAFAGISFGSGSPSAFSSPLFSVEGAAAASSPVTGNLLFYSDGRACYDRNHNIMPNGAGLLGNFNGSAMQGVCIVPFIDAPGKYFLFSLNPTSTPGQLWYSVVDMTLNNGLGDIAPGRKNMLLDTNLSEAMIAIPGNNCDIWLVVHTRTDPFFKSYRISSSGLDPVPVLSATGGRYRQGVLYNYTQAYDAYDYCMMAVSPDRKQLALGSEYTGTPMRRPGETGITGVLLCHFDAGTGRVSDGILLGEQSSNNICFSPDNSRLYIAYPDHVNKICSLYQYNVTLFDSSAILNTAVFIQGVANPYNNPYNTNQQYTRMCQFRDTIYMSDFYSETIHRINHPNQPGTGCDFQLNALPLLPGTASLGNFPSFLPYPMPQDTTYLQHDTFLCPGQNLILEASGIAAHIWDDGSRGRKRSVSLPGTYYVMSKNDCQYVSDTFLVHFREADTLYARALDTIICNDMEEMVLSAEPGFAGYRWDNGSSGKERVISERGHYWVFADNYCQISVDSFIIGGTDIAFSLGNDIFLCMGMPLMLQAPAAGIYQWSDGSTGPRISVTRPGVYWLSLQREGCIGTDTILVTRLDIAGRLGNDTVLCQDQPIDLPVSLDLPYEQQIPVLWSDGGTGRDLTIRDAGSFWAEACNSRDTIRVTKVYCDCPVEIPTAFTPNGDRKNDLFRPLLPGDCPVKAFTMQVYNRWGAPVFTTDDIHTGWNGIFADHPAEAGNYMYELQFEAGVKKNRTYRKGSVMLIR